jgi:dipeptide/tripeptide permease
MNFVKGMGSSALFASNIHLGTPPRHTSVNCLGNLFRFTYYGIKAILLKYLISYLHFGRDSATAMIHTFNMLAYACTLPGGVLSDGYLGRFRTIVYLSLVYCVGNLVLSFTAVPGVMSVDENGVPSPWGMVLGLLLLAIGTGGIKPCVAAFGGDQFYTSQTKSISLFFSLFYFSINSGSLLSMLLTPKLRELSCFNMPDCFPLAFGIPSGLMLVSTSIFIAGHAHYRFLPPAGNMVGQVMKAIGTAIRERSRVHDGVHPAPYTHWIDYASVDPAFTPSFLKEVKQLMNVLWVFLPLPIFWALYDQQSSRWTVQAGDMQQVVSWKSWSIKIAPEQMQATNAFLILAFIPFFQQIVYPRVRFLDRPLRRIASGMVLVGMSFLLAAAVQWKIDHGCPKASSKDGLVSLSGKAVCVPIAWQIPQYVVLTAGEIMFSITGLEFAFRQSPASLKGVCQSAWQLTVAFGNLIVIVVAELSLFAPIYEFIFFASGLFLAAIAFVFMARGFDTADDFDENASIISSGLGDPPSPEDHEEYGDETIREEHRGLIYNSDHQKK